MSNELSNTEPTSAELSPSQRRQRYFRLSPFVQLSAMESYPAPLALALARELGWAVLRWDDQIGDVSLVRPSGIEALESKLRSAARDSGIAYEDVRTLLDIAPLRQG